MDPQNADKRHDNTHVLEAAPDRTETVATTAVRLYDPNHLIFGDKPNGNTATPNFVVALAAQHMDLVFYQWYATYEEQATRLDRWSALTGKPLFNGDSAYSVPNAHMPNPLRRHYEKQEAQAAPFLDFAEHAFARPDFAG